ncbi:phosphoenolpyruvate synthase [Thermaurantiacus sp.]
MEDAFVRSFESIRLADVPEVGGKNASLGEMTAALAGEGVRVPRGFATTASAFREFLAANALEAPMAAALARLRDGEADLDETGERLRSLILGAPLQPALAEAVRSAYRLLREPGERGDPPVAVRSSATAEDLPGASFAGQQESFLNVVGEEAVLDAVRRCFASLYTDRAISYREAMGFQHESVALSVGVQRMVRAESGASGVMFTLDPDTGFPRVVAISAAFGLGEPVVQGQVDPDCYLVFKPLLADPALRPILARERGTKLVKMVLEGGSRRTRLVPTTAEEQAAFVLSDDEILELGRAGARIEAHYGRPMDIEWAKDGETGQIHIVQARPETVHAGAGPTFLVHHLEERGTILAEGQAVGSAVAVGPACRVDGPEDLATFRAGSILVARETNPDWVPIMKKARALVTDRGGTTSHAAIVARELGLPAVVGTGDGTARIPDGATITLSCAEGETGRVYAGALAHRTEEIDLTSIPQTRTRILLNLADPASAFRWWRLPAQGVGLARMEFIISNMVRVHPMAIAHPERLSPGVRRAIDDLVAGYPDAEAYFVSRLGEGIGRIASVFHPHLTIVRLSDFKTSEYARLLGGAGFEEEEANPMLGFRGAARYGDPRYRDGFALECRAIRHVRETIGLANVAVMVPFCRTLDEADRVLATMAEFGLERGRAGLQVWVMCELPANVVLAEEFAARFDGFSIGSNDLTQLVLGVDRDNAALAALFDERDPAVARMIMTAIEGGHRKGIPVGICGQAPSDHPAFAQMLVEAGIDSLSLNPDSFVRVAHLVAAAEAAGGRRAPGGNAGSDVGSTSRPQAA